MNKEIIKLLKISKNFSTASKNINVLKNINLKIKVFQNQTIVKKTWLEEKEFQSYINKIIYLMILLPWKMSYCHW